MRLRPSARPRSYIYLGATVSLPAALSAGKGVGEAAREHKHTAVVLAAFVLGAVAIGLILIDHEHCDAGHEGHGDEEKDAHGH